MKKLSAIFLVFVLLLQMCIFNVGAQETGEITVGALEYINGTPSQQNATGGALIRENINLGYEVNLENKTSLLELSYRTGTGERGIIEIRLGAADGPVIGTLDTTKTGSPDWTSSSNKISLSQELKGTQYVYICGVSGAHWIEWFKLIPDASGQTFARFSNVDNFKDIADDTNRHEINLLSDLGIISKDAKYFEPIQPMSRIEFVSILGNLLGAEMYAQTSSPFADISTKDENFKILSGLYNMGIIKGDTEGNFRPYRLIKPEEAATVCINALGYNVYANNVNTILDIANNIDLFDGVNLKNAAVTKSDSVKMIYNLLLADYLKITEFDSKNASYTKAKNFIEKNSQYIHGKGVMTANSITNLYEKKKIDGIEIDEIRYLVEDSVNIDFLGAKCEFFYRKDGDERILCAIRPLPKTKWSTVTSGNNIRFEKINEREIVFTDIEEDEEIKYELSASTPIIYNGTALKKSLLSLIPNPQDFVGDITFIDNNDDGECECVWIDHLSRIIKVGSASDGNISDVFTNTIFKIANTDFMLYMGTRFANPKELFADDILMVYESSDEGKNKLIRAVMKKQTGTGKIAQVENNGLITINDEKYKVSAYCTEDLYAGYEGTFIVDSYNRIIEAKKGIESNPLIGAFLAIDDGGAQGLATKARVKLLTEEGILKFDVANRVIADGVLIKNADDFYDGVGVFAGMSNIDSRTPVRYQLNADGEIKMIDTVKQGTNDINDTVTKIGDAESFWYYNNVLVDNSWLYKYAVSKDVKLISLTSDGREENYTISTGYTGFGNTQISLAPYTVDPESVVADILLAANYTQTTNRAEPPFVFNSLAEKVSDVDGETVKCVRGTAGTKVVEYEVDIDSYSSNSDLRNKLHSLKNGDIVWVNTTKNRITSMNIIYIPSGLDTNAAGVSVLLHGLTGTSESTTGGGIAYLGQVEVLEETFVMVKINDQSWMFNCASTSVVVCEKTNTGKYICNYGQSFGSLVAGDTIIGVRRGDQARLNEIFVYRDNSTY